MNTLLMNIRGQFFILILYSIPNEPCRNEENDKIKRIGPNGLEYEKQTLG